MDFLFATSNENRISLDAIELLLGRCNTPALMPNSGVCVHEFIETDRSVSYLNRSLSSLLKGTRDILTTYYNNQLEAIDMPNY